MGAQLYNRNEKRGQTRIGTGTKTPAKRTLSTWSDMPHWPKKSLEEHGKEKGRKLEWIQQEEGENAKVFIRENTWQRKDLSVARHMVERHLERAVDTNPKQEPN